MKKIKIRFTKQSVLLILVAMMGVVAVLMNTFAGLRPFYNEGSNAVWRAVSFSTIAISWLPLLIGDILADKYDKKIAIGIPAFIFALQAIIFGVSIAAGYKDEGWQNLWAGVVGNYSGLIANYLVFIGLKKLIGTDEWYKFLGVAIVSTVFGQLADNLFYMILSPFQWAGNVFEGGSFIGFAKGWKSINIPGVDGAWTGKAIAGWDSLFLKSAFEIGAEVLVFPITLFITKAIDKLPEY